MKPESASTPELMAQVREDLEREQKNTARRSKMWIALQCLLIVFVISYMTWLSGAVSSMDAESLTRMVAVEIEEEIPHVRAAVRDHALQLAPQLTDQAQELFLEIPTRLRENIENQLLTESDKLMAHFEAELNAGLTAIIDERIEVVQAAYPDLPADQQLDNVVMGVSGLFRDAVIEAVDELYIEHAGTIEKLNAHLVHLQRSEELTESERIDKELLETWMLLVHKHEITKVAWGGPSY
jgi:hypothetical protein